MSAITRIRNEESCLQQPSSTPLPLGALIRYTDGSPKPPARFTKKLAAWERSNGVGRLVKKEPPRPYWRATAWRVDLSAHGAWGQGKAKSKVVIRRHSRTQKSDEQSNLVAREGIDCRRSHPRLAFASL